MIQPGISIVICTYNGAALLPETLCYIARQEVPVNIPWEVIVVDNASSDNSAQVAGSEWAAHACATPFRVVQQPLQGLSFARELGFAEARYAYIIMCDDDNWLAPDYVANAYRIMEQNPAIGMLGGQAELAYETTPQKWAAAFSHSIHAGGPQAPASGRVGTFSVYGAGSVLRKTAYLAIREAGFQFKLTDRLGNQLSSGGDSELCYALAMANYLIWYDASLRFRHYITAKRVTWDYYINYLNSNALSFIVLEPYKIFLDTNSSSLVTFSFVLFTRIARFILSLSWTFLTRSFLSREEDRKVKTIKIAVLRARLGSYRYAMEMGRHFLDAGKYRHLFNQRAILSEQEG